MLKYYLKMVVLLELGFASVFTVLYFTLWRDVMTLSKFIFTYGECSIVLLLACLVSIFIVEYFDL